MRINERLRRASLGEVIFACILMAIVVALVGLSLRFVGALSSPFGLFSGCSDEAEELESAIIEDPAFSGIANSDEFQGGEVAHGCDEDDSTVWVTLTSSVDSGDPASAQASAFRTLVQLDWRAVGRKCYSRDIGDTDVYATVLPGYSDGKDAIQLGVSNSRSVACFDGGGSD